MEEASRHFKGVMLKSRVKEEMPKNDFIEVVGTTQSLLKNEGEWRDRYAKYAEKIQDNLDLIRDVRSRFHEWSPLNVYMNISSAKNARTSVSFELRYLGQTVAKLVSNRGIGQKLTTKPYDKTNLRDFGCPICFSNMDWRGDNAKNFRDHFKTLGALKNESNEEHRLQDLLLTEFSRKTDKTLRHIKPVTIARTRFPMPTPISASDHKQVTYSEAHGGGIDILARTGTGGKTHLCILELKDENTNREPPKDAMKQAVAYSIFIRELLRSDSGAAWWKLFGFRRNIPKHLELFAICAMPSGHNNDYSFRDMKIDMGGDTIKLHYMYFTEENNKIRVDPINTSLGILE
ncbi:hypothetical protein ABFB09_05975 [Dehalogenimonas sp. THU2]|uniref:hypothetical protein n=1 Tax=Dehalogenimonas sp. THU2 TaxID=3151121 RepID=UPI003218C4B0